MGIAQKRSDERMGHRTQQELVTDSIPASEKPLRWPEPDEDWHPIALYAWQAFKDSPMNVYYTETDIAFGWMACDAVDAAYLSKAAMKISAAESLMKAALFNEQARRQVKIEIARKEPETNPTVDKNVADFRARRGARSG